jgi:serine/threonine-protein kinase RsbW
VSDERAIYECDRAEQPLRQMVEELLAEVENIGRLGALLPFCSACRLDLVIPADPALVHTVTDGVVRLLQGKPGVVGHEFEIELALQEALANAVRHGCQGDPAKSVECRIAYESTGEVRIVVRDPGPGFDVSGVPSPLDDVNVLRANGRGLFLIHQLMDEVRFADGGREIQMRKRHSSWRDSDGF